MVDWGKKDQGYKWSLPMEMHKSHEQEEESLRETTVMKKEGLDGNQGRRF